MYDIIIIGSGPAGLTAAIYTSRAELKVLLLAGPEPGGQLMRTTDVENYPGFPEGILGPELMDKMTKQASRFGSDYKVETVISVDFSRRPFKVNTDKGQYQSKAVIIASGAEAKWLDLPNEQRLRGKGVSACATCDGFFFKGKEIVVVGGGDSAMEEAIFLTKFASRVTLIHRRDEFRASKIMLKRAQNNPKIEFITNIEVMDVLGKDKVEGVLLQDVNTKEKKVLKVEGLFLAIGHKPNTDIYKDSLEMDKKGYIKIMSHSRTSVEGVFASGDVHDFRYRQAITAAGMGCAAAIDAERWLAEQRQ